MEAVCKRCDRRRRIKARGLCPPCYGQVSMEGRRDEYPAFADDLPEPPPVCRCEDPIVRQGILVATCGRCFSMIEGSGAEFLVIQLA